MRLLGCYKPSRLKVFTRKALACPDTTIRIEQVSLHRADGQVIRAFLTGPAGDWQGQPAILYAHAHGNRYDIGAQEALDGRPALLDPPYGIACAKAGFVTLTLDLPCFGARAGESEQAAAKRALWHGHTLFGEMLSDLAGGLDFLTHLDGIDAGRIGVFGISMGATLAFWLGALESRIRAVAHLISFADLGMLIDSGAHDLHGIYMMVSGLIPAFGTGEIAGLIAPRPQWIGVGALDPLTPLPAVKKAEGDARIAYAHAGAEEALHVHISAESGHLETPDMRAGVLAFFTQNLCAPR